jgi:hypothetical protein
MMMSEIITKTKSLAENDQSIASTDITAWVDDAIQRINQAMQCNIATTGGNTSTLVPAFDPRFHECLVNFCVGRYRESDSDYNGAQYWMNKFENMLNLMQRDMVLQPSSRVDYNVQQILATSGTLVYTLTIPSGSYLDIITVYKNDVLVDPSGYSISGINKNITFSGITFATNDKITIVFENNSDLNNPPYLWWTSW